MIIDYLEKAFNNFKTKKAVILENEAITYEDMQKNVKIIATNLLKYDKFNKPIAVYMDKGINTLEAFFGILYSGNFYSLINTEFPDNRIEQIINTLGTDIIISDSEHIEKIKSIFKDKEIIDISSLMEGSIDFNSLEKIRNKKCDIDPVYINFTSGSTGVPKGVVIGSSSIIDFIEEFTSVFNITENDIIANQAPFDFDVSVKDIYSSFFKGATLLIVPRSYFSSPVKLLDYLCDNKATTLIWAVSALCLITTFHGLDYKTPETVNKVIFSGEVMPLKHLKQWISHLHNATFVNVYGPTEITCNCTYYIIDNDYDYEIIPIGKSFKNERVFLLDENDELITEKNKSGEICVSGRCLALGYFNNKAQTDAHFVQNPLNKSYIEMIYRTGDLGYIDNDDNFVFNGRKDFQIKYMGHRIELEEIDREISKLNEIKRAVTIFSEKKNKIICFYIGDIEPNEIVNKIKDSIPGYMVPSILKKVDDFVLNKNGKVDRKILLESIEG